MSQDSTILKNNDQAEIQNEMMTIINKIAFELKSMKRGDKTPQSEDSRVYQKVFLKIIQRGDLPLIKKIIEDISLHDHPKALVFVAEAIIHNQGDILELFLEKGASLQRLYLGLTPFEYTLYEHKPQMAEVIIHASPDMNLTHPRKESAIHQLSRKTGFDNVITLLKENGVDINKQNANGDTPLQLAIMHGAYDNAKTLLILGANPNSDGGPHGSPLLLSCLKPNHEMAEALLKHGADPNQTSQNQLPLKIAIHSNAPEIFKLLLAKGADINLKTHGAATIEYALHHKHEAILKELLNHDNQHHYLDTLTKEKIEKTFKHTENVHKQDEQQHSAHDHHQQNSAHDHHQQNSAHDHHQHDTSTHEEPSTHWLE